MLKLHNFKISNLNNIKNKWFYHLHFIFPTIQNSCELNHIKNMSKYPFKKFLKVNNDCKSYRRGVVCLLKETCIKLRIDITKLKSNENYLNFLLEDLTFLIKHLSLKMYGGDNWPSRRRGNDGNVAGGSEKDESCVRGFKVSQYLEWVFGNITWAVKTSCKGTILIICFILLTLGKYFECVSRHLFVHIKQEIKLNCSKSSVYIRSYATWFL